MFASLTKLIDRPNAHIFNHLDLYYTPTSSGKDALIKQLIACGTRVFSLITPLFPEKGRYVRCLFEAVQIYEGINGKSNKNKKNRVLGSIGLIFSVITIEVGSLKPSLLKSFEVARSLVMNALKLDFKRMQKKSHLICYLDLSIDILNIATLKYDSLECRTLSLFLQVCTRGIEAFTKRKNFIEMVSKIGLTLLCARNFWTERQALHLAYRSS